MAFSWKTLLIIAAASTVELLALRLPDLKGLDRPLSHPSPVPAFVRQEDEDEFTTVKGPGHEGILSGLSGIFSNIVGGNIGGIVESSFNFVPPVYQKNVNRVYGNLLGKTDPPPTTPKPTTPPTTLAPPLPAAEEAEAVEEAEELAVPEIKVQPPTRRPVTQSNPDDEEEEEESRTTRRTLNYNRYRPRQKPKPAPLAPAAAEVPVAEVPVAEVTAAEEEDQDDEDEE